MSSPQFLNVLALHYFKHAKHNFQYKYRLIKHTELLLEDKEEEKLCIKVLQTLKDMMALDTDYGEKVIRNISLTVRRSLGLSRSFFKWLRVVF